MGSENILVNRKEIIGTIILAAFFIGGVFLSQRFSDEIVRYLDFGFVGMFVYVFAGIVATVIAPFSTLPLVPMATMLWGPLATALLSVFAWSVGAVIAFLLARRYGRPLAARFVDMEKLALYEKVLDEKYLFWNVIFLRMAVPVDILSYAIGIFSSMNLFSYTLATVIGITPFAFIFAYASRAPLSFQILALILALGAVYLGYRKLKKATYVIQQQAPR